MKATSIQPVIAYFDVIIQGVEYKGEVFEMEVHCHVNGNCESASCEKPFFTMGSSFWVESFGKAQDKRIRSLCKKAVKDFLRTASDMIVNI